MTDAMIRLQIRATDQLAKVQDRRDAGQGALEYVGMVAVAALIVIAILGLVGTWDIGGIVTGAVTRVRTAAGGGE
ncbi:MAG TPA: hypothetical protein VF661_06460 [Actinomycetales bacterium]|jgi:hypothetical protein